MLERISFMAPRPSSRNTSIDWCVVGGVMSELSCATALVSVKEKAADVSRGRRCVGGSDVLVLIFANYF
jgi:hypothetical protein